MLSPYHFKRESKLNKAGLEIVGDISWPEHVSIFTVPVTAAVNYNIPLIVWGENPQNEYGGPATNQKNNVLDRNWLEEFGGLIGLRVDDMVGHDGLSKKDLSMFYSKNISFKNLETTTLQK